MGWTTDHGPRGAKYAIAVSLAHLEVWRSVAGIVAGAAGIIALVLFFFEVIGPDVFTGWRRFLAYGNIMSVLAAAMLYPVIAISNRRKTRVVIPDRFLISVSIFIGAVYVAAFIRLRGVHGFWPEVLSSALLAAIAIGIWFVLLSASQETITVIATRRSRTLHPRAAAAFHLVVADWIAIGGKWRYHTEAQHELLYQLESAATTIEHHLPKKHASGDPVTDAWLNEQFAQTASAIRELKRQMLLPSAASVETLAEQVRKTSIAFTTGNWSDLPKAEVKRLSVRTTGVRLLEIARGILIAAVPLAIVVLLGYLNVPIPPETMKVLIVAASVWAAVGVVTIIDPEFATRIKTVKEVLGLASGK